MTPEVRDLICDALNLMPDVDELMRIADELDGQGEGDLARALCDLADTVQHHDLFSPEYDPDQSNDEDDEDDELAG